MRFPKFLPDLLREKQPDPNLATIKNYIDYMNGIRPEIKDGDHPIVLTAAALMAPFFKHPYPPIYVLQKDFYSKFKNVKLDQLQFRHVPVNAVGFVKLPIPLLDSGIEFDEFFFYAGSADNLCQEFDHWSRAFDSFTKYPHDRNMVSMGFVDKNRKTAHYVTRVRPRDDTTPIALSANTNDCAEYIPLLYNVLAYINSGDPDIREYKNPIKYRSPTSKTPTRADSWMSTGNIVLVGYNYLKDTEKHTDEWDVMPHFRWQRCGTALQDVKLIWVKGHKKRWRKDDIQTATENLCAG